MDSDKYLEGKSMQRPPLFESNSQVKDNKIDLLVQQYEQFTILEEESIDSGFARFNTIITSLKALDEESKDLSSLALDELICNLKVHEMVMEKDSKIYRGKKERIKSIALKAKKDSSDDETSTSRSNDEEYAMAKGKSDRKCFRCGDPNHLICDCLKPPRNKDQNTYIGGSWSDSENDAEDKTNDETCLMAQSSNEVTLNSSYYSDNASSLDDDSMQIEYDNLCEVSLKIINKNKILKTKRDLLEKEILELNDKIKKLERNKGIDFLCESCQELKLENTKLKETQIKFVKFDKSANSLKEMLSNQKTSSCKIGIGFDGSKASTSGTKPMIFVGSTLKRTNGSTVKGAWILHTGIFFRGSVRVLKKWQNTSL
ncbi:zf-CCHC domain-containing protein [Tanacetum coccineum]